MEKLNKPKLSGEDLDKKINNTMKFYKRIVLKTIEDIRTKIQDEDYGTRYIRIMQMLFDLPVKDLAMKDGEKDKLTLRCNDKNDQIFCTIPIFTEDGNFYENIGVKNCQYLLNKFNFDEEDFEGDAIRAWEYIFDVTPIPTQQLYDEYKKSSKDEGFANWMANKVTDLIKNMRIVRHTVLGCKYLLAKNKMYKKKNKQQLKKQAEINEKRKEELNQLLKKNDKKIEQECQSNYFLKWKGNVKKYKRTELLNKLLASKIKADEQTKQEKKARDEKQQLAKTFYTLKYNDIIQRQQEKINEKQNKLKTSVLKGLVKQKIDDEKNIMSKTFHNWHSNTLKQNNETLKQSNRDLQIRVNNLKKGYAMVNERNKADKEELEKKIADVKQELNQLTNKKNKEIEDLKLQHEKEKKDIIQQCNKEANSMFHNAALDMSSKITQRINEEVIPNYKYYKNRYWEMYNDQMELKDKYNELLQQNNELKDKIEQLKPKLNINAKKFITKNTSMNANMQLNNHNHINYNNINYNNLNTMSYFYQKQAFGGFVNGKK